MKIEPLNTFVIDMTQEKGNRFRINGDPIDVSNMERMDIHISEQTVIIKTTENGIFHLGVSHA